MFWPRYLPTWQSSVCHAPIQHDQTVLKASLKPSTGLSNYHPFFWSPKNILKEKKHKSSTGEEEEGIACFGWVLQIDKFSISLLLPLPSPLYFKQFLNMVFISPTNSSLVQYWPPFNFFSMLEISMGAWNTTKFPFSDRKHSEAYKVRAQRGLHMGSIECSSERQPSICGFLDL